MTTPAALLSQARAEGVTLVLAPPDRLKLRGDPEAVARWAPVLRAHKSALLRLVSDQTTKSDHDPLPALYREWLAGTEEPRALVTLTPDQTRAAMAAGVVSLAEIETSVLMVYRSPLGALGMLAVPRTKFDAFSMLRAAEALAWAH